jgi:hypothetical protein
MVDAQTKAELWTALSAEASRRGLFELPTPSNSSRVGVRAGDGVTWAFHHRAQAIRVGILSRDTETSNADDAIALVKQMQNRIESDIGLSITFDLPRDGSPSGRAYVEINSFDSHNKDTWPVAINSAVEAMGVFIRHLEGKF